MWKAFQEHRTKKASAASEASGVSSREEDSVALQLQADKIVVDTTTTAEQAALIPRQAHREEETSTKGRSMKATLLVFLMAHAIPIGALVWYFRREKDNRLRNSIKGLPTAPEEVLREAARTVKSFRE